MRAIGPGSVSSILKTALDVVYFVLWVFVAVAAALAVVAAVTPSSLDFDRGELGDRLSDPNLLTAVIAGGMALLFLLLGAFLVIVERLRRIFGTLTAGDPFQPENVKRLRVIGLALAGLELISYAVRLLVAWAIPDAVERVSVLPNLTAWFAVLVVFVLAEVFREGARLRHENELTI